MTSLNGMYEFLDSNWYSSGSGVDFERGKS